MEVLLHGDVTYDVQGADDCLSLRKEAFSKEEGVRKLWRLFTTIFSREKPGPCIIRTMLFQADARLDHPMSRRGEIRVRFGINGYCRRCDREIDNVTAKRIT